MIVPSIDIQGGHAVQLVGGREREIDAGDPFAIAERFSIAGPLAVIDLDAAMGKGDNRAVIEQLVRRYRCRVGGGIRSVDRALEWLDLGAERVILGTAARVDVLGQLPKDRVMAALDAVQGEVVVEGWQQKSGERVEDRIVALREHVGSFLLTFVEHEGRLRGTDLDRAKALVDLAGDAKVTIAGGVSTADEISALDALGADAQVGMALYKGTLPLADALAAPLTSDRPDGLWPTVVCDEQGVALGLVYSDLESLRAAMDSGTGVYHSRKRGLWRKGATSGDIQKLLRVDVDCDRDSLRFIVRQGGSGFCHKAQWSCFGPGEHLGALSRTIRNRVSSCTPGSYTARLVDDPALLREKLAEEAEELADAKSADDVCWEAADVIYFALVKAVAAGVSLADIERELSRRSRRVRRRHQLEGQKKESPAANAELGNDG